MRKVAIVMGSKSDLPVAEKAVGVLRDYGVQMEVRVLSAHRCPNEAREFAASAREGGFSVILAFAGMAAHLAGAMAANTKRPSRRTRAKTALKRSSRRPARRRIWRA